MFANRVVHFLLAIVAALSLSAVSNETVSAQPFVSPMWLRQHLHDQDLVVIDVYDGDQRAAFAAGHIPGALFTDFLHDGWRAQVGAAPGMLPAIKDAEKLIGGFGIDNKSYIALVPGGRDNADFNATARIYWTFKALGHDNVSILEGGDKAWLADESNPVETGTTATQTKKFVAHFRRDYLATRDDVKRAIRIHDAQLIDARPPAQFEGKAKSPAVRVAGTLPGALNVPAERVIASDGTRLADTATIDEALSKAGVRAAGKQIMFCNTGHLASGTWFMFHEIKGNKRASLYAGGMSEWTSDPELPVVNQPQE